MAGLSVGTRTAWVSCMAEDLDHLENSRISLRNVTE